VKSLDIVTINFNDSDGIFNTLESFSSIDYARHAVRHIIIDGGSSDGSVSLIEKFSLNNSYAEFISEPDGGIFNALNKGIARSNSGYILFINSGDLICADSLEHFFASKNNCSFYIFDTIFDYGTKKKYKSVRNLNFYWGMPFCHQSIIIDGGLHRDFPYQEDNLYADYVFFKEFLKDNYQIINRPLSIYKTGGVSDIASFKSLISYISVHFHYYSFRSILLFLFLSVRILKNKIL